MKNALIAVFLFSAIAGKGQSAPDSMLRFVSNVDFGTVRSGPGWEVVFWQRKGMEIKGDTTKAVRSLAKSCDSVTERFYILADLAQDAMEKQARVPGDPKAMAIWMRALRKYRNYRDGKERGAEK